MTVLFHHAAAFEHRTPHGHPERPERMKAVQEALGTADFSGLDRRSPEAAALESVFLAHPEEWVRAILRSVPSEGLAHLDSDTVLSPGTMDCVLRGVGAAVQGVDLVMTGTARNAFSAMRPPGHHAERTKAMGFCVFNNAAIAALHARKVPGAERVAIVDWDVHHGNGTQDIVWSDPSVLFCSTHQMPLYPGSGAVSEEGEHGTIVNAPLKPFADGDAFQGGDAKPYPHPSPGVQARPDRHLRRVRTPIGATRWPTSCWRPRISPGRPAKSWKSPTAPATAGSCRCWKAATT